jgi:PKD repeat protein
MCRVKVISIFIGFLFVFMPFKNSCQNINVNNHSGSLKYSERISQNNQCFIENKGQWSDDIKYLARMKGLNLWVTDNKIIFDFFQDEILKDENNDQNILENKIPAQFNRNGCVIEMSFNGNNQNNTYSVKGQGKKEGYLNYLLGSSSDKWVSNVPIYSELYLKNVSDGIDMKIMFDKGFIRYDMIVIPGSDPSNFKINFKGQQGLSVINKDELEFITNLGTIMHNSLNAYQNIDGSKFNISCRFVQTGKNEIKFETGNYDKSKELIIDPLIYSTFLGGSQYDEVANVVLDTAGNVFAVGATQSTNVPVTSGAYNTSFGGNWDAYLTKLNSSGTGLIYSTYFGGSGQEYGIGIDIMPNGEATITGLTYSTNFPLTSGAYQTSHSGTTTTMDCFISRLNSTGSSVIYSTYLGGSSTEACSYIKLDASGNAFLSGFTASTNFPTTTNAYQTYNGGGTDGFVTKLNSNGTALLYSTYIGGSGTDYSSDIEIDPNSNAYVTGYTYSSNFRTTSGAYQTTFGGGSYDGFIMKLNYSGTSALFSTFFGKSGNDIVNDIELDSTLKIYIAGSTSSTNFQATAGAIQTSNGGGSLDGFIAKFNSLCNSLQSFTYLGGSGSDEARGLCIDHSGNIYTSGITSSSNFPVTSCSFQTSYAGNSSDVFVSKITSALSTIIYSTYFGGNNTDLQVEDLLFDNAGNVVLYGRTLSTNFPITSGALSTSYNGGTNDGFVAKMDLSYVSSSIVTGNLSSVTFCGGGNLSVPFSSSCPFNFGNVFTVQISDNAGSFNNPVNIGSLTGFQPTTISARIPDTLATGNSYRVRVVSSDPYAIGTTTSQTITIGPKPIADFSINDTGQCVLNNSFVFTNNSYITSGYVAHNIWNFGDNANNYDIIGPTHVYANANTYNVSLITISDINCKDTVIKKVYIDGFKKVSFDVNDSTQCLKNNQFNFTNKTNGVGNINYLWTLGNGSTSTTTNASVSYSYDSTFSIKLKATSDFGCVDSAMKKVYAYPDPYVDFLISNPDQCYRNHNFAFTNHSSITSGTLKYLWNFGDGDTSSVQNVQHKYSAIHSYFVKLWVSSDNGCKDSLTKTVFLRHSPTASFTVSDTAMCFNSNRFYFTNSSTLASGTLDYLWIFKDSTYCYSKDTVHVFRWADTFDVVMQAITDWGCVDSMVKRILVKPAPDADFTCKPAFDQCFKGNSFNFQNQSKVQIGSLSYSWDLGDGTKTSNTNIVHSYATNGSYAVKLLAYNNTECRDSITKIANVNPEPVVKFDINDSSQCLSGNSFTFTNKTTINSGTLYYFWAFGDGGYSMLKNSTHKFTYGDSFEVKLTVLTNIGCNDSLIKKVFVSSGPKINLGNDTILADTQSITLKAGSGNDKYLWSTGATTSQIKVDTTGIGLNSKMFWVIATKDSCSSKDSIKITFIHKNSIFDGAIIGKLTIYPNPTSGELYLKQEGREITDIQVIDLLGKVRLQEPFRAIINVENLPAAVYIVNALNKNGLILYQVRLIKY